MQGRGPKEILKEKYPDGLGNMDLLRLISEYKAFRRTHAKHFRFNSAANSSLFGEFDCLMFMINMFQSMIKYIISGEELEAELHLVHIFFDTATFDNIQKDKKIKFEAQLSLVGGTMGLLTGFSIISAIEIINFFLRLTF